MVTAVCCGGYNPAMVDANMPWSLKGISDEARDFAREAAAAAEVPVGAWLSAVIHAAALQEQSASTPVTDEADVILGNIVHGERSSLHRPADGGNTIERAVQIVSDFGFEPEGPARDEDLIEDIELIEDELEALEKRLAEAGEEDDGTLAPLRVEVDRLRRRLAALRSG